MISPSMRTRWIASALTLLLSVFSVLWTPVAGADNGDSAFQEFLNVPANDRSSQLLQGVVGPVWLKATGSNETTPVTGFDNTQVEGGIMGVISGVLNSACMVLTMLIVMIGGAFAALTGAHGGSREMVQKYHMLWVPLRTTVSFALLAQVAGGYSLIQIGVMKAAYLGIGVGDAAYHNVLDYLNTGKGTNFPTSPNSMPLALSMFESSVCTQALNTLKPGSVTVETSSADTYTEANFIEKMIGNHTVTNTIGFNSVPGYGLPVGNVCGSISVSSSYESGNDPADQLIHQIQDVQTAALVTLHSKMDAIAAKIIQGEVPGSAPIGSGGGDNFGSFENDYQLAVAEYNQQLSQVASNNFTRAATQSQKDALHDGGWILLGAYYWNIQAQNARINAAMSKSTEASSSFDATKLISAGDPSYTTYVQMMNAADAYVQRASRLVNTSTDNQSVEKDLVALAYGNGSDKPPTSAGLLSFGTSITKTFIRWINADGDPIINLQGFGQYMFGTGITAAGAAAAMKSETLKSFVGAKIPIVGQLSESTLGGRLLKGAISDLGSILGTLAIPLIVIGIGLAYYVPFIPLFLWVINVVGWMILFGKALLAAPIWAAAHAIPEGEGFAGSSARQGYNLMIALVLGPILMVAGMLLGLLMLNLGCKVAGWLFPIMMESALSRDMVGIFGAVVLIAGYTALIIAIAHKCFALSSEVRDEILRWIGGHGENLGDSHSESRISGVFANIGSRAQDVARNAVQASRPDKASAPAAAGGAAGGGAGAGKSPVAKQDTHL